MALRLILPFALIVAIFLVPISRAYADTNLDFVAEWARAHAVELTDRSRPMVFWYLRNARALRTIGVLAGLVIPSVVAVTLGGAASFPQHLVWLLVGYFIGALYAEITLSRPKPAGRAVTLVARDVSWYLPRRLIVAQKVMLIASPLLAAVVLVVPIGPSGLGVIMSRPTALAVTLVPAVIILVAMLAERWVVRRPQPFTAPDMLAADDAIRSQSVHSLAGSALGAGALLLTGTFWFFTGSDVQFFRWTMWAPMYGSIIAALIAVRYYTHRAWRVQRPATSMAR